MDTATTQSAYAALYAPTSDELTRTPPMIADGLHARLLVLTLAPTHEAADQLVRDVGDLLTLGMKIGDAIRREAQPQERVA